MCKKGKVEEGVDEVYLGGEIGGGKKEERSRDCVIYPACFNIKFCCCEVFLPPFAHVVVFFPLFFFRLSFVAALP